MATASRIEIVRKYKYPFDILNNPYEEVQKEVFINPTMETEIPCTNCGKTIKVGESYSSGRWESVFFGLPICEECHIAEQEERRTYKEESKNIMEDY